MKYTWHCNLLPHNAERLISKPFYRPHQLQPVPRLSRNHRPLHVHVMWIAPFSFNLHVSKLLEYAHWTILRTCPNHLHLLLFTFSLMASLRCILSKNYNFFYITVCLFEIKPLHFEFHVQSSVTLDVQYTTPNGNSSPSHHTGSKQQRLIHEVEAQ